MRLYAEGVYLMRRFTASFILSEAMDMTAMFSLMQAFQHVREKVERTVTAIHHVKVCSGETPRVPPHWIRPSFEKPVKIYVRDREQILLLFTMFAKEWAIFSIAQHQISFGLVTSLLSPMGSKVE